jgi:hypothetical protein
MAEPVITVTTSTALDSWGPQLVRCDSSGGSIVVTLPTGEASEGKEFTFVKVAGSVLQTVTIDGFGSETIGGASSFVLTGTDAIIVICAGGSSGATSYKVGSL